MFVEYSSDKIQAPHLLAKSIEELLIGTKVSCKPKGRGFESFGEGVVCDNFFMGKVHTNHIKKMTALDINSYILTIPVFGKYDVNALGKKVTSTSKYGAISMPTEKIIYDSTSEVIADYEVFIHPDELNPVIQKKFNISKIQPELLILNLKSEKVQAISQFIQSSITMLSSFRAAQKSRIFKNNLQEIITFMIADLIGEQIKAKPITNNNPEKNLVRSAEEYIDNECETIFSIQQIADKLYTNPRNIQIAFKKYRNYTPMQFLKTRKLHKAHKNILLNKQIKCTVKEIALSVGIFDLNRFSKYYAEMFGELPSATIKRTHG